MNWYRICYQKYLLDSDENAFEIFEDHLQRSWFDKCEKWIDNKWVVIKTGIPYYSLNIRI